MILASFDIGIKNMAFCLFDCTSPVEVVPILDWQVLNLVPDKSTDSGSGSSSNTTSTSCNCVGTPQSKKKGSAAAATPPLCGKKAKFRDNKNGLYCKTHALQCGLPCSAIKITHLRKMDISALHEMCQQYHLETHSTKTVCIDRLNQFYKENTLISVVPKKINAKDVDLVTIGKTMTHLLDQNKLLQTATHVLIENQISPIANRMKTIQGMLTQYFIMRCGADNHHVDIEYVSSANKLKHFVVETEKTTYKQHKKDGVYYTTQMIDATPEYANWKPIMESSSKKDDLADCFLQGLWYIREKMKR